MTNKTLEGPRDNLNVKLVSSKVETSILLLDVDTNPT